MHLCFQLTDDLVKKIKLLVAFLILDIFSEYMKCFKLSSKKLLTLIRSAQDNDNFI